MCGISGFISKNKIEISNIKKTLFLMKNRGPDNQNYFISNLNNIQIGLLHSRLSIIDIDKRSNQPFEDGMYKLIFNGEIYNFEDIKKNLIKKNYKFKTQSDTEVLLKSYIEYGEDCVKLFDGMWAFCIYDYQKKKMFLSRDIFGEKPLYYYHSDNKFVFGSEIKFLSSLLKKDFCINKNKINDYLFNGYKSLLKNNETYYKKIFSLEPGYNIIVENDINIKKYCYWKPKINNVKYKDYNEILESTRDILFKSVKSRMKSDVPISFSLSGGIDSAGIASIARKILNKKINCFSIIDSDERYNELSNIKKLQKNLDIKVELIRINDYKKNFLDRSVDLINYHDGPISTISYYIQSYIYESMSKKKIKVSLSGTGADEIFTGYYDHFLQFFSSISKDIKNKKNLLENVKSWKKFILPNIRNPYLQKYDSYLKNPQDRTNIYESHFNLKKFCTKKFQISRFYEKKFSDDLLRNRMLNELFYEVVPIILKHDDLNSMNYSIENRSPYLNLNLLNNSFKIPTKYLISNGYQKKILRDLLDNILVDEIRLDRVKKGFNSSISSVFNLQNKDNLSFLFNEKSSVSEFVDLKLLKKNLNTKIIPNYLSKFIFSILNVKIFLDKGI